jgi:hypothetical protein
MEAEEWEEEDEVGYHKTPVLFTLSHELWAVISFLMTGKKNIL